MTQKTTTDNALEQFVEDTEALQIDTDVESLQRANREKQLQQWDLDRAHSLAAQQNIHLSDAHLTVVTVLRDYYLEHGEADDGRVLEDMLHQHFEQQGGKKHLHQLFPKGPVSQGMIIADLPLPPHSIDSGFGTAR